MLINAFLLSVFAKNSRFTPEVKSIRRRQQVLSIIYVNLVILLASFGHEFLVSFFLDLPSSFCLLCSCAPFVIISFLAMRKDNIEFAAMAAAVSMHAINFSSRHFLNEPVVGIYALMFIAQATFFLSSTMKLRILSAVLCTLQYFGNMYKIKMIFSVTLNEDQSNQISRALIAAFVCLTGISLAGFAQKEIEINVWEMAESNYKKSENLTKEVLQAIQAKDAFVSSLSHEIRNPLNSMKGSIEYLLQTVKDPNQLKILKNAQMSSEILLNLINNVLDTAKLRSEKMEVAYSETDFFDILRKVLTINSETLRRNHLIVKAFVDSNLPKLLWTDPSRILQVMMNVFSNALKFTPKGGKIKIYVSWCPPSMNNEDLLLPIDSDSNSVERTRSESQDHSVNYTLSSPDTSTLRINKVDSVAEFDEQQAESYYHNRSSIRLFHNKGLQELYTEQNARSRADPWNISRFQPSVATRGHFHSNSSSYHETNSRKGYLKVQITDTGCGIAPDNIPKLFKMFTQAHNGVASIYGGTGLGLWICKQLCQKMGGDITLYSELNKGTTFVFCIPVDNDRLFTLRNVNLDSQVCNALVADDYGYNRDLHKLLLEGEGVQVVTASNGKEAIEKFKLYPDGFFSFIILDVQMPELDGFAAARYIREWEVQQNRKKVDIYFISGEYYNEEDVMNEFKSKVGGGVNEVAGVRCLRKPVDIQMVRSIVRRYKALSNNLMGSPQIGSVSAGDYRAHKRKN